MFCKRSESIKNFVLIITLILTSSFLAPVWAAEPPATREDLPKKVYLGHYLRDMGVKLDCYFTLEDNIKDGFGKPLLHSAFVSDQSATIQTIEELIAQLRTEIPDATAIRNKSNPQIIHLADTSLSGLDDYALDRKINLSFSGYIFHLMDALSEHTSGAVRYRRVEAINSQNDRSTQFAFEVNDMSVRDLLTQHFPLSSYRRVIWNAEAVLYQNKPEVWMTFQGPTNRFWARSAAPHLRHVRFVPAQDFELGEVAFRLNYNNPESVGKALDYIESQFAKDNIKPPRQVRWAMLFLGKHKVETAIPILLEHLNYQYGASPLLEEQFPAFAALKMMGEPANDAVLKALSTETNSQKLQLLARLLLAEKGKELVQTAFAAFKDEQRDRVLQALAEARKPTPSAQVQVRELE